MSSGDIGPTIPLKSAKDSAASCKYRVNVLSARVVFSGTLKAPELKDRVAAFLQYKTERVFASWAGVTPEDVASMVQHNKGSTITVRLRVMYTQSCSFSGPTAAKKKLKQVLAPLYTKAKVAFYDVSSHYTQKQRAVDWSQCL